MKDRDKFFLEIRKIGEPASISYRRYINGQPFKMCIGYSILPELWNSETQRPTSDKKLIGEYLKEFPTLKTHLSNIEARIHNFRQESAAFIHNQVLNKSEIDLKALKDHLNSTVKQSKNNKKTVPKKIRQRDYSYITQYAQKFINEITLGERKFLKKEVDKKINVRYGLGTIKSYKNCIKAWEHFEQSKGVKYKWSDFNKSLYDELIHFLELDDYRTNYIGKVIKCLKVIFRAAYDANITTSQEFNKKYFIILSVDSYSIALTENEVEKIESIDLSKDETLRKAKDMFLLGCYTALRISDLKKINKDHIKEGANGKFLDIISTKTKNPISIPLSPSSLRILKRYKMNSPNISEQKVNKYIKEIAKTCGIVEKVSYIETVNNIEQEVKKPKYELITNHTGRRTAATLMYKSGIPSLMIMSITGHKTESSFLKYIKITKEEAAERMAENKFFK